MSALANLKERKHIKKLVFVLRKNICVVLSIFIISGLCFGQVTQIAIPEGTMIMVRLEQDLSGKKAKKGQPVQLSVMDDVMIDKTVVIAQGASVAGRVIVARTGLLDFSVESVIAVDKTSIPLRYNSHKKEGDVTKVWGGVLGLKITDANINRGMTFEVFTDRSHNLPASSVAKTALVNILSVPSGADVEIDGDFVGNTPLSLDIPAGNYAVVVKKKGFMAWNRSLKTVGVNININAELEQDAQYEQGLTAIKENGSLQLEEAKRLEMERPEAKDTSGEKTFRTYLRARLDNLDVLDDNEVVSVARGKFKLDEIQALRVFEQEIERINQKIIRNENIKKYTEDFELFILATKGVITKTERDTLNAIAESLSLTVEDVKTVESAYEFKDESAP